MRALAAAAPLALLLTALLSGCAGSGDPAGEEGPDGSAAPASAAAGGAPSASGAEAEPAVREEALQVSGSSPVGACVGVSGVFGNCFNDLGDGNLQVLPRGTLEVRGTMTWSAASPATGTMGALLLVPCGEDCWTSTEDTPAVYGASPLQVDLDAAGLDDRVALWFSAYQGTGSPVGWAGVHIPQEFAFEGVVVRES
jgi:hypothetical protein